MAADQHSAPAALMSMLPAAQRQLLEAAAQSLPARTRRVLTTPTHRALGRVIRDAVLLLHPGLGIHRVEAEQVEDAALASVRCLAELQRPSGTFRGGDNVDSPPDTAFTVNDLAWAHAALHGPSAPKASSGEFMHELDKVLTAVTPALVSGGLHTPNHRWEIASALTRLWEAGGPASTRERAIEWLAEGVDLQSDGMFSERSANYAAHVSLPSLWTMGRILERPELIAAVDRGSRVQAELTGEDGMVETLASRRQDQFEPFDGGALHPWFRAHAARTGDRVTARAAQRTAARADADAVLTLLALAVEDPTGCALLPEPAASASPGGPELVDLDCSGLVQIDHGISRTTLFGGTDTARIGRITSGTSCQPVIARFRGRRVAVREVRLSQDFFSLGPVRPGPPRRLDADGEGASNLFSYALEAQVGAEYFQPLTPERRDISGRYAFGFNGRFAAAMDFSNRPTNTLSLHTSIRADAGPGKLELRFSFNGPDTAICLLLALDGDDLSSGLRRDEQGRHLLEPAETAGKPATAQYTLQGDSEQLVITARGDLGGRAFYDPGEAYTFLGASDEPDGEVLLIPARTSAPLTLALHLNAASDA